MNQSQNDNKSLTADDMLKSLFGGAFLSWGIRRNVTLAMEQYASQEVKRVTEERDKAVKALEKVVAYLSGVCLPDTAKKIAKDCLKSLNAAKEGGE